MFDEFWTISIEGAYLNSNIFAENRVENLKDAVNFNSLKSAMYYRNVYLSDELSFKILKVNCTIEEEILDDTILNELDIQLF